MPKLNLNDPLVKDFVSTHAGEQGYLVLKSLARKGKTDEQICKTLKVRVNDVRSTLNTLHYLGVITYTKIRDRPNWYTYTWFLKEDRIAELLKERYAEELKELEKKHAFEETYTFFKCPKGCAKLPFEIAMEYDFKCPECGNSIREYDNKIDCRKILDKMSLINSMLQEVDSNGFKITKTSPMPKKPGKKKPAAQKTTPAKRTAVAGKKTTVKKPATRKKTAPKKKPAVKKAPAKTKKTVTKKSSSKKKL